MIEGCAKWIGLAGALELLSVLGFVVVFKLVFVARMTWRQGAPAGLRAIGATTVLPVGGFVGPAVGAGSTDTEGASLSELTRSSATFLVLTKAPGVIVLAALGPMLWAGWLSGPHEAILTLLPAGVALAVLAGAVRTRRASRASSKAQSFRRRGGAPFPPLVELGGALRNGSRMPATC